MNEIRWPKHEGGLSLKHNEFKGYYQTIEEAVSEAETYRHFDWVSPEQREKAIRTDSLWVLQWYPDTPVGFLALAASDLDVLLAAAQDKED